MIDGLRIRFERVEDQHVRGALRDIARNVRKDVNQALIRVGERTVLPEARAGAPNVYGVPESLRVIVRDGHAVLTTSKRGGLRAFVGMSEFGGVRRDTVRSKQGTAMPIGDGFAAEVSGPRTYKPRRFMTSAVVKAFPDFQAELQGAISDAFERNGLEAR